MTKQEIIDSLAGLAIPTNVWLNQLGWHTIVGTVCLQSTYHIYTDPTHDYFFDTEEEVLKISFLDENRTVKRIVDFGNIVCFNGTHQIVRGIPYMKNFK